jgi:hypothetical protein
MPIHQTNPEENNNSDSRNLSIAILAKTHGTKDPDAPLYKKAMKGPEVYF